MNSFQFREGSSELLSFCDHLWDSFIKTQTKNAGEIAEGIAAYLQGLRDGDLLTKTVAGKLYIQLIDLGDVNQPIGFCLTSLSEKIFFIAEGLLFYLSEIEVKQLIVSLKNNFAGSELIFDSIGKFLAKNSRLNPGVSQTNASFKWGIDNLKEIEN